MFIPCSFDNSEYGTRAVNEVKLHKLMGKIVCDMGAKLLVAATLGSFRCTSSFRPG